MNIVIMAGGGGTRLWPLSRQQNPKQFVDLGTGKPLLVHAYERATQVTQAENVFVATSQQYEEKVREILPNIPTEHLFLEPSRRDTTAAFVHTCLQLVAQGQRDVPTTFLWSDHLFTNEAEFVSDLKRIPALLKQHPNALLIIGHTAVNPNTSLGYFQVGEAIEADVFKVAAFHEKPDEETAKQFVASGTHYWNLGYFSLQPSFLLEEIVRVTPELGAPIATLGEALNQKDPKAVADAFEAFPKKALEYTFVEKLSSTIAITGDYGWSDIGSWATVQEVLGVQGDHVPHGHHVHVDAENNYVYNATSKAVSLVGVKDTIVVVTEDAILVANKADSHKVKQVVERIEQAGKTQYL